MDEWFRHFKDNLERQIQSYIGKDNAGNVFFRAGEQACFQRKMQQLRDRNAQIIDAKADEQIIKERRVENRREVEYSVRYKFLIQQKENLYTEEVIQKRKSLFENEKLVDDYILNDESHRRPERGGQDVL
ncbi:MAG: hypothetical protein AB1796_12580 [Bacillota bacterium]